VTPRMEEFAQAKLKLQHGLKSDEAIEITWPRSSELGKKHLRASFKKNMREYLQDLGLLNMYQIETWANRDTEFVQIVHEEPSTGRVASNKKRRVKCNV